MRSAGAVLNTDNYFKPLPLYFFPIFWIFTYFSSSPGHTPRMNWIDVRIPMLSLSERKEIMFTKGKANLIRDQHFAPLHRIPVDRKKWNGYHKRKRKKTCRNAIVFRK